MSAITPAMWQRMPWHAKAKAVRALDREAASAAACVAELRRITRGLWRLHAQLDAETILDSIGPDPDAEQHRGDLLEALGWCRDEECGRRLDDKGRCVRHEWRARAAERWEETA